MYTQRIQKIVEQMESQGIDFLILSSSANLYYLTGQWLNPGRRLLVLTLDRKGQRKFIGNSLLPVAEGDVPFLTHRDQDDWIKAVSAHIPGNSVVGVDRDWNTGFLFQLMAQRQDCRFVNGSPCIEYVRQVKEPEELRMLQEASKKNDFVMGQLIRRISPDLTERQLAGYFPELCGRMGTFEGGGVIAYGPNALDAHHQADDTPLRYGDSVLLDIGARWGRYRSDMTRTVFYGTASQEQQEVYAAVLEAHLAAAKAAEVGMPIGELDRIGTSVFEKAGYGAFATHRIGHSIGLDIHELPYVSAPEQTVLRPGMVFTIEPGIYKSSIGGVRIEDIFVMTLQGAKSLNEYPKELLVLPVS